MRKSIPSIYLFSYSLASFTGHERRYLGRRVRSVKPAATAPQKTEAAH